MAASGPSTTGHQQPPSSSATPAAPVKQHKSQRRKISLPWFRQNSALQPLARQHTIDTPTAFHKRLLDRQPSTNQVRHWMSSAVRAGIVTLFERVRRYGMARLWTFRLFVVVSGGRKSHLGLKLPRDQNRSDFQNTVLTRTLQNLYDKFNNIRKITNKICVLLTSLVYRGLSSLVDPKCTAEDGDWPKPFGSTNSEQDGPTYPLFGNPITVAELADVPFSDRRFYDSLTAGNLSFHADALDIFLSEPNKFLTAPSCSKLRCDFAPTSSENIIGHCNFFPRAVSSPAPISGRCRGSVASGIGGEDVGQEDEDDKGREEKRRGRIVRSAAFSPTAPPFLSCRPVRSFQFFQRSSGYECEQRASYSE
ncbi:hypothetical protein AAG570_011793 [Ranatra chinensis]|uniref:Uncharacterized protein n=1 Tax=Ranatra chinensis TaxID=642074 RepID=A0ABD0YH20_9HEMI